MQKRKHGPIRFSPILAGVVIFGPRDPLVDRHGTVSVMIIVMMMVAMVIVMIVMIILMIILSIAGEMPLMMTA